VSQKNAKNILKDFGLTNKEVAVYLFLAKQEILSGGEIAKQTKIDRSVVYRILKSLQAKGLVEATLESPTRFVAITFEKALDLIIKTKQEEALKVEKAKKHLVEDWKKVRRVKSQTQIERFIIIEGNKKIHSKILQMIKSTRNNLSGILPISGMERAEQFGVFDAVYDHPLKNKIQFQFVTEMNKENLEAAKLLLPKLKFAIDLKTATLGSEDTDLPRLVIRDHEEVMFFTKTKDVAKRKQSNVCILTNSEALVQTFSGIFKSWWRKSADLRSVIVEIETGKTANKNTASIEQTIKHPSEDLAYPLSRSTADATPAEAYTSNISLLTEEERDILDFASVVGEEFPPDILEKVSGYSRLKVLKSLIKIESENKLIQSVGEKFRFVNPQIRETLYNEVKPKLRRFYHSLAAQYLEESDATPIEKHAKELAHHYYQSKNPKKAVPYLLTAGKEFGKQFAFSEAVKTYSKALEMMGNEEVWSEERTITIERLGDLTALLGDHEKANECYNQAITIAKDESTERRIQRKIRRKRTIKKDGLKIQYYLYGEGDQTILFVWHSTQLMPQIQYFSQKFKVAIMDFEEIWESKSLPTEYTIDLYTENLRAIIEDLQDTNIFLVGVALGGTLAVRYVAEYQGRVGKLALLATPPKPPIGDSKERKKRLEEFWALALQSPIWGLSNLYEKIMAPIWPRRQAKRDRQSERARIASKVPPEIRLITLKLLIEADIRPLLGKISVPTLILHGEKDILPVEDVEYLKESISGSKLHIFRGASLVTFSEPEKFNKILEEFLADDRLQETW
jgi:pimeloyl-ACP methyl ester carboxylesterase/predicted DNA-binding transcriptional regulator